MKKFDGKKLRECRLRAGFTGRDLGVQMYLHGGRKGPAARQEISDYEIGEVNPNANSLAVLARIFSVPVDAFFSDESE